MLTQHATTEPTPPSLRSELPIPPALDDVVLACLAKDPGERPQGAAELAARLEGIRFDRAWDGERAREWWDVNGVV